MIRMRVLFPNKPGSHFDWDYYKSTHHSLVEEKLKENGILNYEIDKGIGTAEPGKPAPYIMIANLTFNSIDEVQSAFKKIIVNLSWQIFLISLMCNRKYRSVKSSINLY